MDQRSCSSNSLWRQSFESSSAEPASHSRFHRRPCLQWRIVFSRWHRRRDLLFSLWLCSASWMLMISDQSHIGFLHSLLWIGWLCLTLSSKFERCYLWCRRISSRPKFQIWSQNGVGLLKLFEILDLWRRRRRQILALSDSAKE